MANKSAFIRAIPHSVPASEVVMKGKAAGLVFSDKYVWSIRAKEPKKAKLGRPKGSKNGARKSGGGGLEQQFVDAALDLGLSRAEAILKNVRSSVRSVVAA